MNETPQALYTALQARDARFDGRFFVGVISTGIYCRPVCPARTPRFDRCRFFSHAALAEKHGFRPCLRCRPELAPSDGQHALLGHGMARALVQAAARLIEQGALNNDNSAALAARIGVSPRHLNRLFKAEFGVSPLDYQLTQRLLTAKRLLVDSTLSMTEIAYAAGFGSVRRFNALFHERYQLSPQQLRAKNSGNDAATLTFTLSYRPPLAWGALLDYLTQRAITGVEYIADNCYQRSVTMNGLHGWISVTPLPGRHALSVTFPAGLAPASMALIQHVRRMFDLDCRPDLIDAHLAELANELPGIRVPGGDSGFEIAVRAVIGQRISVSRARDQLAYLSAAFGRPLATAPSGLKRLFPDAESIAAQSVETLHGVGIEYTKAATLKRLAASIHQDGLCLTPEAPLKQTLTALLSIKGIGPWTAQYIAMRALSWPDAWPKGDWALERQLAHYPQPAKELLVRWAPWRAYAAMHLWRQHAVGKQCLLSSASEQEKSDDNALCHDQ
ncbi:DNA-3-methyladenine glycosylase 2 family protein [Phytohalomonas tamaricis]|uniref:DNA-3-methyladenine glycosylase 2 family protein n=1 Tax=Phytohalomonas tamaricis TaxID=2081032 RepID=UPI000D0ABE24|nr:DNA-3-methyladenine glycosylase 2 family protein [Phytohalomonas tamaricis]